MFTIFTNVSYASFPINNTLTVNKDSIHSETVEQYHLRMQAMGFDISDCRCEYCQKFHRSTNFKQSRENAKRTYLHTLSLLMIFLGVIVLITLSLIIKFFAGWLNDGAPIGIE